MTDFTKFSDTEVIAYLSLHFDELGVGHPPQEFPDNLIALANDGDLSIIKRDNAFAVVCHPNRQSKYPFIQLEPQSDLMFLFVAPEARRIGVGRYLLDEVVEKFVNDQGMELVCAGDQRKHFFERAGFKFLGTTQQGLNYMFCPPSNVDVS